MLHDTLGDTLGDTLESRILALIRKDPAVLQQELSEELAVSIPTVKRTMKRMTEKHIIERKGGRRYGRWEIPSP